VSRILAAVLATLAVVALSGCGDDDDASLPVSGDPDAGAPELSLTDPLIRLPAGANTAMYLEITNAGTVDDRLVSVSGPIGEDVQLHETTTDDEGRMGMQEVGGGIPLPAGETVALVPGGLHVMILGVGDLAVGDEVDMELRFEVSEPVTVTATVTDDLPAPAMDMGGGEGSG
jgi:hypothetical protein